MLRDDEETKETIEEKIQQDEISEVVEIENEEQNKKYLGERRRKRNFKLPSRYEDYVMLAYEEAGTRPKKGK